MIDPFGKDREVRSVDDKKIETERQRLKSLGLDDARIDQALNSGYFDYTYKRGLMDVWGSGLGFRTKEDKYREEMKNNYNAYISQLLSTMREEKYNSEAQQTARMRSVGQNPDLLGTSGASEASEFTEPEAMPEVPNSEIGEVANFFTDIGNAFNTGLGVYNAILATGEKISEVTAKNISNYREIATSLIPELFTADELNADLNPTTKNVIVNNVSDSTLRKLGVSSAKARKHIQEHFARLGDSIEGATKKYRSLGEYLKAQDEYTTNESQWYRQPGTLQGDASIRRVLKEWNDTMHRIEKYKQSIEEEYEKTRDKNGAGYAQANAEYQDYQAKAWQSKYSSDYFRNLNGEGMALYDTSIKKFEAYVKEQRYQLIKKLRGDGSTFALIMALQLSGETDVIGNSGLGNLAGVAKML